MKVTELAIPGPLLIELDIYRDNRGFFVERFNEKRFSEYGVPTHFVQDNHSRSAPGVLRGMHVQPEPPQGKLVGVLRGRIFDVAVDVRRGSPTFGKHVSVELSDANGRLLWIPFGFLHGFCVVGDEPADVLYKVNNLYNPKGEIGYRWNDPAFGINWPIKDPIVSARDLALPEFSGFQGV